MKNTSQPHVPPMNAIATSADTPTGIDAPNVLRALAKLAPFDAHEAAHQAETEALVRAHPANFWSRANPAGHVTASVFVVDSARQHALLLHHAALGKWLQPGGHVEADDASIEAAARRELAEECGIHAEDVVIDGDVLFDIDVHSIPARVRSGIAEPAHRHHDLRVLAVMKPADAQANRAITLSVESHGFQWVPLTELAAREPHSGIGRMARKTLGRK